AGLWVKGRIPHLAKELAVLVDAVAAVGVGHHREALVAVLGCEVRPVAGQDVRVGVDLEHPGSLEPWDTSSRAAYAQCGAGAAPIGWREAGVAAGPAHAHRACGSLYFPV